MSCDPLWERKRSVLFQLGEEQEGNGSKSMAGSKREGTKEAGPGDKLPGGEGEVEAGPGDGLPGGEGEVHPLVFWCCVLLCLPGWVAAGKDTCHTPALVKEGKNEREAVCLSVQAHRWGCPSI